MEKLAVKLSERLYQEKIIADDEREVYQYCIEVTISTVSYWASILICAVLGIYICDVAEEIIGVPDAGEIVFDEFVGMWITLLAVPHHFGFYVLAFALFRLFDITKIFPINNLQKLPGGLGIMIDDIVAGAMARIVLAIILWVMTLI